MADEFDQMYEAEPIGGNRMAPLPGFSKGFIITDLVFCVMRIFIFLLGVVGLFMIKPKDMAIISGIIELITNFGIAVFGITANTLLLCRKKIGFPLAYICIALTILNMFNGIWGLFLQPERANNTPTLIGILIGGLSVFAIRTVLIGFYIVALKKAIDANK